MQQDIKQRATKVWRQVTMSDLQVILHNPKDTCQIISHSAAWCPMWKLSALERSVTFLCDPFGSSICRIWVSKKESSFWRERWACCLTGFVCCLLSLFLSFPSPVSLPSPSSSLSLSPWESIMGQGLTWLMRDPGNLSFPLLEKVHWMHS